MVGTGIVLVVLAVVLTIFTLGLGAICTGPMFLIGIILFIIGLVLPEGDTIIIKHEQPVVVRQEKPPSGRFCPSCGRSIPFDARICPYCGKNFESQIKKEIFCNECGTKNNPDAKFCVGCGKKF
jgi:RNA polymerase subunit RPABC4/transcription elongation factor Spt4